MARLARHADALRRAGTVLVVLALVWPVVVDRDGLPLSTYPMYAGTRSEVLSIVVARGVALDGARTTLTMPQIAETRDPLIAQSFLNDAVAAGSGERVCQEIAARVGPELRSVEISRERHNVVDQVRGRESLVAREVIVTCAVSG